MQVYIYREDYREFHSLVTGKNPPDFIPVAYRIIAVEDTTFVPESEPHMIVRIRMQYVGQTKV
jgi:hypothetical protein